MKTKLIILGSGSSIGSPRIDGYWGKSNRKNKKNIRTRCSAIIIKGNNSILIDTSPDIKTQFINNKIKNLSSVVITHEHADQTNGLFELRPFFWKLKKRLDIYGNLKTINLLKKRHAYCFRSSNGYPAFAKANKIKKNFYLGKSSERVFFKTFQVKHGKIKNTAYIFENTAYISDCNDLSIAKMKELKNLKYLIIDCFRLDKRPTHFNLDESLYVHSQLKPKKTILTNLHLDLDYNFLLQRLPKDVVPAYDGLKLFL
tara:strand:+ start:599 stop:1369 length:771 start_codon:yes stop_codon:yes gene_type:complete